MTKATIGDLAGLAAVAIVVSVPIKPIFLVLFDGWGLVAGTLMQSTPSDGISIGEQQKN